MEGCTRQAVARSWCKTHHQRWRNTGDVQAHVPVREIQPGGPICAVEGCERDSGRSLYCPLHYSRLRRTGDVGEPSSRRARNGERRYRDSHGYVIVSGVSATRQGGKNAGALEHRMVMEQLIGRPLRPEESVHHRNGVRDDNRAKNLELWSKSHPAGQRVEDKVTWAREILALYGDLDLTS